ncbi:ABC transporter permease, partial [Nocardia sp. NPDC058497]|uniref:ABC transporter permease n=1 Tax=Nocardia sp. NPDC058497 TaxID=3346529 RepID=UPI00365982AF
MSSAVPLLVRPSEVTAEPPAPRAIAISRPALPSGLVRTSATTLVRITKPLLAFVLLLAAWELAPRLGVVDEVFLPSFSVVVQAFAELTANGQLGEHVSASLTRSVTGFSIALVIAAPVGIAIAWYKPVSDFLNPVLELFRNTAALALLPVFVLILGIGETSKIALIGYATFFPILLNTITGVRTVDPLLVKSAVSLGFSPIRLFQKVILPAAIPSIFILIRMAAAVWIIV